MIGKNLKITTRLTISAAAFLLPLAVMFFMIISASLASIRKDREELKGIEALRSAVSLMQIVPQYTRLSIDRIPGDLQHTRQEIADLLDRFSTNGYVSVHPLLENWGVIAGGDAGEAALAAYGQFIGGLRGMVTRIGDSSGLVTDPELESSCLATILIQELPRVQERIVLISKLLREPGSGALSAAARRDEFRRHIALLDADHALVRAGFEALEAIGADNATMEIWRIFEGPLQVYNNAVAHLVSMLEYSAERRTDANTTAVLQDAVIQINNAAYRLENALLDRQEALIDARISAYRGRFIQSLALAIAAVIAAFVIIIITAVHIRASTRAVIRVFKLLEKNDLSVSIKALSRDEIGELMIALNGFLEKLKTAFISFNQNAAMVSTAVYDLSASAKEITTTANEQSASVAEIVSTMESSKNLSEQVAAKTVEVAELAGRTQELSQRGADLRDANEDMMMDIRDQNAKTIEEIRNLADMLSRIDESVQLIDTIADQTKLIAFNAALEASSSGEAGSRFAVVASEIRRFADNVVESVVEIKEKISEVQEASQVLISEANSGSRAIEAGYDRMVEQKEVFENIVDISQNVATRSQQISNLSKQQELASAQIFTALKEISAGVKQFVTATASTSATADNLNSMSIELKETLAKYQA
jgi:methyl-accepting chemotaxis protein